MPENDDINSYPVPAAQVEAEMKDALTKDGQTFLEKLHAEVDTFWQNVFANVSSKIETPLHNYLHAETEALKARLKALF